MCVYACTLWHGVYVWMQTESAFTERFMLIVMNGSCWSGKGEGQTEGDTLSEIGKKSQWNLTLLCWVIFFFLFCFICLVPGYNFITPPTNYLLTFFLLCGVYVYSWSQFTLMLLDYLGSSLKIKRTVFFFYSSGGLWHQALKSFQWIYPPPCWAFQIRPAAPSLSSTFPWKSIHLYSSTHHFLPPFTYPLWIVAAWCPNRDLTFLSTAFFLTSVIVVFSLRPLTITCASKERVFPIPLPEKENLSDFPLVSAGPWELWFPQMNSVRELDLIEKTQAWSAMEEMAPVSQLNCMNVLSRAGEGEHRKEEKYKNCRN